MEHTPFRLSFSRFLIIGVAILGTVLLLTSTHASAADKKGNDELQTVHQRTNPPGLVKKQSSPRNAYEREQPSGKPENKGKNDVARDDGMDELAPDESSVDDDEGMSCDDCGNSVDRSTDIRASGDDRDSDDSCAGSERSICQKLAAMPRFEPVAQPSAPQPVPTAVDGSAPVSQSTILDAKPNSTASASLPLASSPEVPAPLVLANAKPNTNVVPVFATIALSLTLMAMAAGFVFMRRNQYQPTHLRS